jgi:hypothetical protein
MSHTSRNRRHLAAPKCWQQAGNDPSRPGRCPRRTGASLITSERLAKCPLCPYNLARMQMRPPHPVGVTSIPELGADIKSP